MCAVHTYNLKTFHYQELSNWKAQKIYEYRSPIVCHEWLTVHLNFKAEIYHKIMTQELKFPFFTLITGTCQ